MSDKLTHIAGTLVVDAPASFLNGAGLGDGEDRNVTVPKTFRDGKDRVPYVSAQAWRRWLRNTLIEETGWPKSEIRAIGLSEKGTTNKISGEVNPIEFPEDDIFGYMRAEKGQGRRKEEEDEEETDKKRVKSVMRASPFIASLLVSLKKSGWQGRDEGFVHLKEGTPQPYTTEFYNSPLQGIFCLNYSRLGIFDNTGDRIELDEALIEKMLKDKKIKEASAATGKMYEISDLHKTRKERATALLKALPVLRGGAKQAQFGTDVSPPVLIMAGLNCGNPIFNRLFECVNEGPFIRVDVLEEVLRDYRERIVTPVFVGIRKGYLKNEEEVRKLSNKENLKIRVMTPVEAASEMAKVLP